MSLLPQINNEINSSVKTEVTLPSKTYRLKVDSTALQLQKGNKTTVSGSEIKLTDVKFTQENKTSIKLEGSTFQSTRSGKNLLNIFDENWHIYNATKQTDGSVKANVQNGYYITLQNTTDYWKNYIMQNKGKTLTFSQKEMFDGYGLAIVIHGERTSTTNGYQSVEGNSGGRYISLTIADDFTSVSRIELRVLRKMPVATFTDTTTVISELQLEKGSTATDYEEYGVMPSPDYPSPIENVEGKNKLNISTIVKGRLDNGVIGYETNVTELILNKNSFTFTVNSTYKGVSSDFIPVIPTKTYVYSQNESLTDSFYIGVACYDKNKNWLKNLNIASITIPSDCYYIKIQWTSTTIGTKTVTNPQLEINAKTPYVPYNSLEVKVEGKNKLDLSKCTFLYCSINSDNKSLTCSINNGYYAYVKTTELNNCLLQNKGKKITFSTGTPLSTTTSIVIHGTRSNGSIYQEANETGTGKCSITIANDFTAITAIELRFNRKYSPFTDASTVINYAMLELGEPTDYEPYKSQVVTFPLSEGQKLMEGSYLADDGIHHIRKQVVLNGTESINLETSNLENVNRFRVNNAVNPDSKNPICSHFEYIYNYSIDVEHIYITTNGHIYIFVNKNIASTVEELKTWLATQYANGTPVIVEYELAEPEIVPYTVKQQEAYNQLNDYELFDGVNYITMISTIPGTLSLAYYDKNNINLIKTEEDRIVGFVDNLEAVKQSIYHILSIERYAYLIYDDNYGVEFEQYIGKDFDYINATIENTLQEALLYDLRILDVSVDNIEQIDINKVAINFTVDTIYGNLVMEVSIDV